MQAENLRIPALIVTIFAWAVLAFGLISALAMTVWLVSYSQLTESAVILAIAGLASSVGNLAFLTSIIAVMIWIYKANANLHQAGIVGLNFTPAWATFSFLVPIMNLFVPYQAMRELANRSAGEPEELAAADVDEVFSWWGCWIGSLVVGMCVLYTMVVELIPFVFVTTPFWATQVLIILNNVLTAGAAFFLIKLVKLITQSQRDGASAVGTFE